MVSTRRRQAEEEPEQHVAAAAASQSDSDDSDDDAPEEVSLATGKQSAEQRRKAEADAKVAARAAAKEKRAAQQERQLAAKAERRAAAAAEAAATISEGEAEEPEDEDEEEEEADEEELDLLPNNILEALASNKRTVPTADQSRLISEQLRRQQQDPGQPLLVLGQAQRTEIVEREVGPVVVRVLNVEQRTKASQTAREFLQKRLYAGVKRSADMLKPARSLQPAHIAAQRRR
ncbi:hypothetical protein D9Q98_006568 [Chlorella vulgaris]|uniref:Uncharacterized protein n=1 Tax=Chlorella vulgaris TaxID=3077 RepID=A0A9D4YV71_CHLVU|nr:hypothetical protein D9Q98_006568 [Chlorella vulgaris]